MGEGALLPVSLTLPIPGIPLWKVQTRVLPLFAFLLTDLQNNCVTLLPTHSTGGVCGHRHFPIGVSTVHVFPSHAGNSNDHRDIRECHADHTGDRGKVEPEGSGHTTCLWEVVRVVHLLQHSHAWQSRLL